MEPKDMTNEELRSHLLTCDGRGVAAKTAMLEELLAREDDALRRENEELKEKVYFFARTFRYYASEAFLFYEKHPLARETDETRAANTTKES